MDKGKGEPQAEVEGQEPQYESDFEEETTEGTESEISESLSLTEKQDTVEGHSSDTGQGQVDPVLSDDDDSDRRAELEAEAQQVKATILDDTSDTDISELQIQDPASDREILDEEMEYRGDLENKQGSVSDDQEVNISVDNYMALPSTQSVNIPADTVDIAHAVHDANSVVSDVFEPGHRNQPLRQDNLPKYNRFDDLRSKYTMPRSPAHKPKDVTLTYLPARGVRSYAPFLKSSPLAEFYRGDKVG